MQIEVGKYAGFCNGVELCTKKLEGLLDEYKELYCIGEVVHNKEVVNHFKEKGLIVVNSLDEIPNNSNMIIRAHGAVKELYEEAEKKNIKVFDLTCPKVLSIRNIVKDYVDDDNYYIVLIAQHNHPESLSTISFCGKNSCIIENEDDLKDILTKIKDFNNIVIIGQTTFSEKKFIEYSKIIEEKLDKNVIIKNTICNATSVRQKEVEELSKNKDCMIIIGGKNSSNTKKLYEIALSNCDNTYWVETSNELENIKGNNIGVTAGASTPKDTIDKVIEKIKEKNK